MLLNSHITSHAIILSDKPGHYRIVCGEVASRWGDRYIFFIFQTHHYIIMSPLYRHDRGGDIYCFTSHCSFVRSISFVSVRSLRHAGGQTRDVDPMSGSCWPTVDDAEPTLAQYWVTVSCLTPRWMWASVIDGGSTLTQPWFQVVVIVQPEPCTEIERVEEFYWSTMTRTGQ